MHADVYSCHLQSEHSVRASDFQELLIIHLNNINYSNIINARLYYSEEKLN